MKTSISLARKIAGTLFPSDKDDVSISEIEAMIRKADVDEDISLGFAFRETLVFAATRAAMPDKSLIAFAWCLGQATQHPELIEDEDDCALLAWQYKIAINSAVVQTDLERTKIESLLDQFETFIAEYGFLQRTADDTRREMLMKMGNIDQAKVLLDKWEASPKTSADPCRACEKSARVAILAAEGDDHSAVDLGMKVISETECKGAIGRIRREMTRPLLRLNRNAEAEENHKAALKRILKPPVDLLGASEQMLCLSFLGKVAEATSLFEKAAPATQDLTDKEDLHAFYCAASATMKRVALTEETVRIKVPKFWNEYQEDANYDSKSLARSFYAKAKEISNAFDQRNGNDAYERKLESAIKFSLHNTQQ